MQWTVTSSLHCRTKISSVEVKTRQVAEMKAAAAEEPRKTKVSFKGLGKSTEHKWQTVFKKTDRSKEIFNLFDKVRAALSEMKAFLAI